MIFFSSGNTNLQKMITKLLQPQSYLLTPITQQLQSITKWIKHYKSNQHHQINIAIKLINKKLSKLSFNKQNKSNPQWLIIFKSLMLIHQLLCIGITGNIFESILITINQSINKLSLLNTKNLNKLLSKYKKNNVINNTQSIDKSVKLCDKSVKLGDKSVKLGDNNKQLIDKSIKLGDRDIQLVDKDKQLVDKIKRNRLLRGYYKYLLRRCQMLPKGFSIISKCYYLINLMSSGCTSNQIIYIFGRYKFDQYLIISDYNLLMAKDYYLLYHLLKQYIYQHHYQRPSLQYQINNANHSNNSKSNNLHHQYINQLSQNMQMNNNIRNKQIVNINKVNNCYNNFNKSQNNANKLIIQQINDILLGLHQKLFHIYYNKYNYKKVQTYIPQWIDLDLYYQSNSSKQFKQLNKQNVYKLIDNNNKQQLQQTSQTILDKSAYDNELNNNYQNQYINKYCNNKLLSHSQFQQSLSIINDLQKFLQQYQQII